MHRLAAALIVWISVGSSAAGAMIGDEDGFDFAVARMPPWVLTATTRVNRDERPGARPPSVADVACRGESPQFNFDMTSTGDVAWLRLRFLGDADEDGYRDEITLLGDRIWLYIDGERWEYANIPMHSPEFSNLHYPKPESDIILPVWRGHQAVRRREGEPWLNLRLIYLRLIGARKIAWSFKSRDWTVVDERVAENRLPEGWRSRRYKVDNQGLEGAVAWCARQVASDEAYILPAGMAQGRR